MPFFLKRFIIKVKSSLSWPTSRLSPTGPKNSWCTLKSEIVSRSKIVSRVRFFVTPWTASTPGSSVPGILQARILEWVAMPSSRASSQPRDQICGLLCWHADSFPSKPIGKPWKHNSLSTLQTIHVSFLQTGVLHTDDSQLPSFPGTWHPRPLLTHRTEAQEKPYMGWKCMPVPISKNRTEDKHTESKTSLWNVSKTQEVSSCSTQKLHTRFMSVADSLCCPPETITTLLASYTPIKN